MDTRDPATVPAPSISIEFSEAARLENPRGVEIAIRRGIDQAILESRAEDRSWSPRHPADLDESAAERALPRERVLHVLGDTLRIGPTGTSPVLALGRDVPQWVKAGGQLEVETGDPVRAVHWGRYLFGERGFAVLTTASPGRLLVRPLLTPLHATDFGAFAPAISREPGWEGTATTAPATGATLVSDASLQPLLVTTAEGIRLHRRYAAQTPTEWAGQNIERRLADRTDPAALSAADVRDVVSLIGREHSDDASVAQLLAALDRSLFAAMSLGDRRRYLLALTRLAERAVRGVDSDQLDAAMVELIASCGSAGELDALLAPLAADGTLRKLFGQFDKPTFRLLLAVGDQVPLTPLEPADLLDIVAYQLKHPLSAVDVVELVGITYDWLRGTVAGLADLPLLPIELGGSLPKLYELYLLLCRALGIVPVPVPGLPAVVGPPDPEALARVRALLASAGTTGRRALLGLKHIEELAGEPGAIGAALLRRVARVLLLEILAAFVTAAPELRAAEIAQRVAAQARLFEALAASMRLKDAGEVGRLMWLLPKPYADDVLRLVRHAPRGARALPRFVTVNAETRASGERLLSALRIARTMEKSLGPAIALAEDVLAGAHRVLELTTTAPRWSGPVVAGVLRHIPAPELSDLLRVAGRLTAEQLRELPPAEFARVARASGALRFVIDAGGHALAPTARRFGSNTSRYEHFLARVAAAKRRLGSQRYHELLERLAAGDPAGFDDADWLSEVAESVQGTLRPGTRPTVPAAALGRIGAIASKDAFRREVAAALRADPGHPLSFLLDETGSLRSTTGDFAHWLEHPEIVEAGHLASAKSLSTAGSDRLVVMSAYRNRLAASTIEHPARGGFMSIDTALDIRGIPVDPETAVDWVSKGLLDPAEFDRARRVRYRIASDAAEPTRVRIGEPGPRIEIDPTPTEAAEPVRRRRKEPEQ
ncbi:polymorphic toxin type 5 domain-containing protein [Nocardia sp. CDC159]|uniref:Polymorphic toxin type 5 domain-containing protein n=1 Tax=Nocardia pulmonis TaxID=2951408 RepID=A0A9X2E0K9_9NOCA|nr:MULTISPECIES: polymorphic toxin type 5 domain-containing protein [Nocardia]MCM6771972.1 polymorphic toxin type 5 domain-containing protein [Nocardia pulmonis]MCM6785370.1 polymorphic toxin type 5 domain-containing protein [Nocardia sp. CDC159]